MKTYYNVFQLYYDDGRVNVYIMPETHESKPEREHNRLRRCDTYSDYFTSYAKAKAFAAKCYKA